MYCGQSIQPVSAKERFKSGRSSVVMDVTVESLMSIVDELLYDAFCDGSNGTVVWLSD